MDGLGMERREMGLERRKWNVTDEVTCVAEGKGKERMRWVGL